MRRYRVEKCLCPCGGWVILDPDGHAVADSPSHLGALILARDYAVSDARALCGRW